MFRIFVRLLSYLCAGLFGLLALLALVASGGRIRPVLLSLVLILITVFFVAFPNLLAKFQTLASAASPSARFRVRSVGVAKETSRRTRPSPRRGKMATKSNQDWVKGRLLAR